MHKTGHLASIAMFALAPSMTRWLRQRVGARHTKRARDAVVREMIYLGNPSPFLCRMIYLGNPSPLCAGDKHIDPTQNTCCPGQVTRSPRCIFHDIVDVRECRSPNMGRQ